MTMTAPSDLLRSSDRQHLMLLYDSESDRSSAEIDCINRALAAGQYCVYATVDANDKEFMSRLVSSISDYERQVEQGNLLVVNFKPFYDSAANGELAPFWQLKEQIEASLRDRIASGKSGKTLLVADAACHLTRNRQFDRCITLEGWWQDTYRDWMASNLDITIICAHPSSVLKHLHTEQSHISHEHSLTLDLKDFAKKTAESQQIRILVAESDADLRSIYKQYLKSLPIDIVAVKAGKECLEEAVMHDGRGQYDVIIIDTHMKDTSGLQVAKKILEEKPDQQIVFTTTWEIDAIRSDMQAHSLDINKCAVLQKPFMFSQLLRLIKPAKSKLN